MRILLAFAMLLLVPGCSREASPEGGALETEETDGSAEMEAGQEAQVESWESLGSDEEIDRSAFVGNATEPFFPKPPVVTEADTWINRHDRKERQMESLREFSRNTGTNNPLALTEQEINELSKQEELMFE